MIASLQPRRLYTLQRQEAQLAEAEEHLLREERRLFQQEWLVDQQEAALEAERARLQAQLGLEPGPELPRQAVGQWEGQPHAPPAGAGRQHPHGLPFLPPVWEDIDAPGGLEQAGMLRGEGRGGSSSSGSSLF
ncbi:ribonuclease Y [Chlorella sorokiniana]|uniref:Ribonuclease Y n=1 Tax=Chlorella sorokiniana TaxID=3076 RepID=A0A2P6TLN0_CHLSO|nr:ribonuclease Y [Chlorella sorokiniana]|eukprot:PRW45192.1 ribonuclease Y [Chlorella sorokiniana]